MGCSWWVGVLNENIVKKLDKNDNDRVKHSFKKKKKK